MSPTENDVVKTEVSPVVAAQPPVAAVAMNFGRQIRSLGLSAMDHTEEVCLIAFPAIMVVGSNFETINRTFVAIAMSLFGLHHWRKAHEASGDERTVLKTAGILGAVAAAWASYSVLAGLSSLDQ